MYNAIILVFRSEGCAVCSSVAVAVAGRNQHTVSEREVWEWRDAAWLAMPPHVK
jgi:hypothetical protein